MRSRTEMVTTTFVDSEEDYSDDDDSEEDWRPSASSKNGRKQKQQKYTGGASTKGRKRKNSSLTGSKSLKRKMADEDSEDDELIEESDDEYNCDDSKIISGSSKNKIAELEQFSDKNSSISNNEHRQDTFKLLVYVKDLTGADLNKNNRLCLWRKDKNNLLQKYIRVKASPEQFLFTSSSVYSSFDDKRTSDFYEVKVKSIDSNRRVKIINPSELQKLALKDRKNMSNSDDDALSDEKCDKAEGKQIYMKSRENINKPVPKCNENEDEDDEEEVEEENDEEEDDCDLEGDDDDDDIEDYDEADD